MLESLQDPLVLVAIIAGCAGVLALVHARLQAQLLRQRIATGDGTAVIDAETGLFAPATTQQCVRAEANRALRLGRQLDVWVAHLGPLDEASGRPRGLVFDLPAGSTGVRLDDEHACIVSCIGADASPMSALPDLDWHHRAFAPDQDPAAAALAFITEVRDA